MVDSLLAAGVGPEAVVVVHNPVEPGEAKPAVPAGAEVVQAERNRGYAGGMNLGIAELRSRGVELLLLLTHDASLRPGALEGLLEAARARPDFGILAPALVFAGTDGPFSFGGITRCERHQRPHQGAAARRRRRRARLRLGRRRLDADPPRGGRGGAGTSTSASGATARSPTSACGCAAPGSGSASCSASVAEQDPGGIGRPGVWSYLLTRNGAEYARRAAGFRGR